LTEDELTLFYGSNRSGKGCIWMATRTSIDAPFSGPALVNELCDGPEISGPCILPDGLTIYYYALRDGSPTYDIYKSTRSSTDEPFSDIQKVGISTDVYVEHNPYVTPDEGAIYFVSNRGTEGFGIWVSYWISNPYDDAIENIENAIAQKTEAIELVNLAIEKERTAFEALSELRASGDLGELSPQDIFRARLEILWAMGRQINAKFKLRLSINRLERALRRLTLEPETEGEGPVHPERPVRPRRLGWRR